MLHVHQIDTNDKAQVKRFVDLHYRMYSGCPQWVPPIRNDIALMLNKQKHPFYEHSEADFFIVEEDGRDVGRVAVIENMAFNEYHDSRQAQFYLFDCEDNQEAANALFERAFEWARQRGLDTVVGPKGFGPLDGYGILVEGFDHRQMMNKMKYNFAYYPRLLENLGFEKEVDFVSCFIDIHHFDFPERIHRIADRVRERGNLHVKRFRDKRELVSWAGAIGKAYNKAFVSNWEYYPLTEREVSFVVDNIMLLAHPKLIKIIMHEEDIVGFAFGFQDISAAMQRIKGNPFPFGVIDLMMEVRRTKWISFNGMGILPDFHGRGGNALLYSEMCKTMHEFDFDYGELTQVAETAVTMRQDLINIGGKPYKNHRVFHKSL